MQVMLGVSLRARWGATLVLLMISSPNLSLKFLHNFYILGMILHSVDIQYTIWSRLRCGNNNNDNAP